MRKVVDSNFLQSEGLRRYLAKSDQNYVVLTDYAGDPSTDADARMVHAVAKPRRLPPLHICIEPPELHRGVLQGLGRARVDHALQLGDRGEEVVDPLAAAAGGMA